MKREERSAKRSHVVASMRAAFRAGRSATAFITEMRAKGLSYRRTEMLSDWRTVNEIESKKGLLRYVRRDFYPTTRSMANVEWDMSQEFMYTLKVKTRRGEEVTTTDRFINLMSDIPLTPREIETQVWSRWGEYEKYQGEGLEELVVESAFRRV